MDNVDGFRRGDAVEAGWSSSAEPAIWELLDSSGTRNTSQWDDDQSRAVEALRIALCQGMTGHFAEHAGRPETRGFTLGRSSSCTYLAEVFTDVTLTPRDGTWALPWPAPTASSSAGRCGSAPPGPSRWSGTAGGRACALISRAGCGGRRTWCGVGGRRDGSSTQLPPVGPGEERAGFRSAARCGRSPSGRASSRGAHPRTVPGGSQAGWLFEVEEPRLMIGWVGALHGGFFC